jgi:dTDP-4-dehydrorhamnose reductase
MTPNSAVTVRNLNDPVIIVTGSRGLFGPYLQAAAAMRGRVTGVSRSNVDHACDLADGAAVHDLLNKLRPALVIHAAAAASVEECERNPEAANRANRIATANLATALAPESRLVYISTDQVYPDTAGPHREGGEAPVNVYGATKLAGEIEALRHPRALVLRTNLFGPSRTPSRTSLSDFVIENLRTRRPITLFRDVLFSPLHMTTLAELAFAMIEGRLTGVYNLGSRDGMSKRDFGFAVAARFGLPTDTVAEGQSTDMAQRTRRSLDLRLDVRQVETALGRRMPTLEEEIAKL